MKRSNLILDISFILLLAASCGTPPTHGPDPDGSEDDPAYPVLGHYQGTATVEGGTYLLAGTFPVTVALMQDGSRVRGLIDIEENADPLAQTFTYFADGEVSSSGELDLDLTDRQCGAGDPPGLCYPEDPPAERVFHVTGSVADGQLTLDAAQRLPVAPASTELPFRALTATRQTQPGDVETVSLDGAWSGKCVLGRSVLYPLPLPMYGKNEMQIVATGAGYTISEFSNDTSGNVIPARDDVILADTLRFDPNTGHVSFVQLNTTFSSWLYVGRLTGNQLTMLITFNAYDDPYFDHVGGQAEPADPVAPTNLDLVGVCNFYRGG